MKTKKSIIIGFIILSLVISVAVISILIDQLKVRDFGGFKISFELRDKSNPDIIIDSISPLSVEVSYNKVKREMVDKHYELIYSFPSKWREGNFLLRIYYKDVNLKGHYSIEKLDYYIIGYHPVWEGWAQLDIGGIYNLSIWEIGSGPHAEISYS